MSGTSLDGIDVAVVEISRSRTGGARPRLIGFQTTPYSQATREAILAVSNTTTTTGAISRLNFLLGELYARAVLRAVKRFGAVDLIGCHGQTIYHEGGRNTLQIGEAGVVAERTGVAVVSNFRALDVAAGGQGAPLVPYVDYLLLRHRSRARVALNIGGIANVTVIPAGAKPEDVIAFDTGPGNMALDALAREYTGGKLNYDRGGKIAASGTVNRALLDELLKDPYYRRKPPKSAGREQYGAEFVERLKASGLPLPDLMATATALTAAAVAMAVGQVVNLRRVANPPFTAASVAASRRQATVALVKNLPHGDLIVSGGGAHNPHIMAHLAAFLPEMTLATSSDYGIDIDAKEAIAFAVLAHETWRGAPANLPSATGARRAVVLGNVTPAGAGLASRKR
jgi:anhydro-N-acetylmuramic acid kinase